MLTNKQIIVKYTQVQTAPSQHIIASTDHKILWWLNFVYSNHWRKHCHSVCFCIKNTQDIVCVISSTRTDKLLLLESGFVFNEGLSEECFHHPEKQDNEDCQCHVWRCGPNMGANQPAVMLFQSVPLNRSSASKHAELHAGPQVKARPCENLHKITSSLKGEDGSGSGKLLVLEQVLIVAWLV